EPVTTVLVLDRSGSMQMPANDDSRTPKIKALHQAASRFIDLMRPEAQTTLLPFSSRVDEPKPFSSDKAILKGDVVKLRANGETALFDATFAAIGKLLELNPPGKKAVVVLTDGVDNRSARNVEQVIAQARGASIPIHMLGLGRPGELDEE